MQASFIERKVTNWLLRRTPASGVRKVVSAWGAVASEIGNVRDDNQDKAAIVKCVDATGRAYVVAIVADGIGGMREGSHCASLTIGAFVSQMLSSSQQRSLSPDRWLHQSVAAANTAVHREYRGQGGSTLVAVLLGQNGDVHWTSAGDSRLYHFHGTKLRQVSVDDTIAGQLGKKGPVPPEHSKILQFIGMGSDFTPHFGKEAWQEGAQYLLTTDGVHFLSDSFEVFSRIVAHSDEIGVTAKRLIDLAKWCGGPDNATSAILQLPQNSSQLLREDDDSLSVWDAFGELQVQTRGVEGGNVRTDRYVEPVSKERREVEASEEEFSLIETASNEDLPEAREQAPKRLCCTNRVKVDLPLSPDGFILRAL